MHSNKETLSKLKPLVSNHSQWQAFSNYLDEVIEIQQRALEQSDNMVALHRSQGAVAALRKLKTLRDEVNGS
jgi:hypothetical protein